MYRLLSLILLTGIQVAISEYHTISACCPEDRTFVYSNSSTYDCVTASSVNYAKIYENTSSVHGYRITEPVLYNGKLNVSVCERLKISKHISTTDLQIPENSCLMQSKEGIIKISCLTEYNERVVWLSFVHKCCPSKYAYNAELRKCVLKTPNYEYYNSLLRNPSIFIHEPLKCPKNNVLVEYRLNSNEFSLNDGYLMLKNGFKKKFSHQQYCIEAINDKFNISKDILSSLEMVDTFLIRICDIDDICQRLPCIRRCCADGEMFTKGNATSYCKKDDSDITFHSFESLDISGNFTKPSVFGVLQSLDCLKYRLDPESYTDEAHTLNERDGSLFVHISQKRYTNDQYCVEKIHNSSWGDQKLFTFLCFDSKVVGNDKIRFKMYPIGLLISCSFYAMTLLVYLSIAKLRNLPGKILICLVCSLFTAYLGIALGQLMPTTNDRVCFISGFFIYFCLIAAFAWMNVMCFDIWQTFGSANKKYGIKTDQTIRFLCYSLYGWGLPILLTIITVSLTKSDILADSIRPQFGHGRCWFTYDTLASANLLFFSGPVGLLFLINFVLFTLTLRYCNKVKREIFRMQSSNVEKPALRRRFFMDKARFAMNTKLFVVMGITWLLELLSILFYDHKKTFFWTISDSFNVLLGVFVFFIFVFKKRVWYAILEKLGLRSKSILKNAPNATCATHSTCAQSISMTRLNTIDGTSTLLDPRTMIKQRQNKK